MFWAMIWYGGMGAFAIGAAAGPCLCGLGVYTSAMHYEYSNLLAESYAMLPF